MTPKVGIAVASYLNADQRRCSALECLAASFRAQTYDNWRMLIVHDGPLTESTADTIARIERTDHTRIRCHVTQTRLEKFGHPHRQWAVGKLAGDCEWILLTNDDNYYCPVFLEWMLHTALVPTRPSCDFVYCDFVRSHKQWKPMVSSARRGHLDLGAFLVRTSLALAVPFDKHTFDGDGDWINRLAAKAKNTRKVSASLFVHN